MKKSTWISASLLSANWTQMGADMHSILNAGADRIHLDIMDAHYVPELTFGPKMVKDLHALSPETLLDVHLMVKPVDTLIEACAKAGATSIVFHPEASLHVDRSLNLIKSLGVEAGLALNPGTDWRQLEHVAHLCDRILLMSVNPGYAGQAFIPSVYKKAAALSTWLDEQKLNPTLEVDGGVTDQNIATLFEAGVTSFVSGSHIFGANDRQAAIDKLKSLIRS